MHSPPHLLDDEEEKLPRGEGLDTISFVNHNTASYKHRRKQNEEQLDHGSV